MRRRALCLVFLLGGCAHAPAVRTPKMDAQLELGCPVSDARVYLDDRFVGSAASLRGRPLSVTSGPQRIEVRAEGYFTSYQDVAVAPGERARVDVTLDRVPEGETGG